VLLDDNDASTGDNAMSPPQRGTSSTPVTLEQGLVTRTNTVSPAVSATLQGSPEMVAAGGSTVTKGKRIRKENKSLHLEHVLLEALSVGTASVRSIRTRLDARKAATGNTLAPKAKPGKKRGGSTTGGGRGRGRGDGERLESLIDPIIDRFEARSSLASNIAAAKTETAVAAKARKNLDIEIYLKSQEKNQKNPNEDKKELSSSEGEEEEDNAEADIDLISTTVSQANMFERTHAFLPKENVKMLSISTLPSTAFAINTRSITKV
jgi:hypothetical protein